MQMQWLTITMTDDTSQKHSQTIKPHNFDHEYASFLSALHSVWCKSPIQVSGLTIACVICCQVNETLDMTLDAQDILISWFVIILALLGVVLLFICCVIHCKYLH